MPVSYTHLDVYKRQILNAFPEIRVDVHHPDVLLQIEVRQKINIYSLAIPGPGGMPVGTNGKATLRCV